MEERMSRGKGKEETKMFGIRRGNGIEMVIGVARGRARGSGRVMRIMSRARSRDRNRKRKTQRNCGRRGSVRKWEEQEMRRLSSRRSAKEVWLERREGWL